MTPTDAMVEQVARALAPLAWAALGLADTLAHQNRRKASLNHARAAIAAYEAALSEAGLVVVPNKPATDHFDPNGWEAMRDALRHANDGFVLTVWAASENGEAGWKIWRTLDGKYANREPGFVMNIALHHICGELESVAKADPQFAAASPAPKDKA